MNLSKQQLWERFQKFYTEFPRLGLALDLSRMDFPEDYFSTMAPKIATAFSSMADLEKGAIANPDENRMVGHYWLRNPALAPTKEIRSEIENTLKAILDFTAKIHTGTIKGPKGPFRNLLLIGIGGSALGPQFVSHALSNPDKDRLRLFTFDNTDPDGMDRIIADLGDSLGETLCVVISKSGGTKETRNGMLEAKNAYEKANLDFGSCSIAITQTGSELDTFALKHKFIPRFPMWDWVGGRTSELSSVGLLPAALQGFDIVGMLAGAKTCDEQTRTSDVKENPAAQLALMWFAAGDGVGRKSMVVLPYKDRLELFSKYLQQLIMESLGKEKDLAGKIVNQGITVFGNKGSTDQHAYVQQLRDGLNNFFVTFIEVLEDREEGGIDVEPNVTAGDYLQGFFLGTRQALAENGRESITITIRKVTPFAVGMLIALFERAVGFYALLINVNAYHQPGVEAGKKAASKVIELKLKLLSFFEGNKGNGFNVSELAGKIGSPDQVETVFKICEHLVANQGSGIVKTSRPLFECEYRMI